MEYLDIRQCSWIQYRVIHEEWRVDLYFGRTIVKRKIIQRCRLSCRTFTNVIHDPFPITRNFPIQSRNGSFAIDSSKQNSHYFPEVMLLGMSGTNTLNLFGSLINWSTQVSSTVITQLKKLLYVLCISKITSCNNHFLHEVGQYSESPECSENIVLFGFIFAHSIRVNAIVEPVIKTIFYFLSKVVSNFSEPFLYSVYIRCVIFLSIH